MSSKNRKRERPSSVRQANLRLVCGCDFAVGRGKSHQWVGECDCGTCEIIIKVSTNGETTIRVKEISYGAEQRGIAAMKKFEDGEGDDVDVKYFDEIPRTQLQVALDEWHLEMAETYCHCELCQKFSPWARRNFSD